MAIPLFGRWWGGVSKPALHSSTLPGASDPQDAESQFGLGRHFAAGEGEAQDYAQAAEWFRKAAVQGHCAAEFNLGLMYGQGQGVSRDETTAAMWLRRAAEHGHARAQYHVGLRLHRAGLSSPKLEASECRVEAFKWLQLAVAQGYRRAQSAQEFVALGMTRGEVDEGGHRAVAFAVGKPKSGPAAS